MNSLLGLPLPTTIFGPNLPPRPAPIPATGRGAVSLDGVGHCPAVESPKRFTDALLEFTADTAMRSKK